MRNLKRALSLTLASVMLLGMMVVGAGAAGYPDVDGDDNVEAIEVLQTIQVMQGNADNGNFEPDRSVTRTEMAVVMALLLNYNYQYYEASCPFWDVPTWAKPYVGACYTNKIVAGYGDGTYGALDPVTPVQAASMMMRALGYFQNAEDYADGFETATVRQGSQIGIFNGIGSSATADMTRNQVAQMALNALESEMVSFTGTPGTTYTSASGETLSIGYRAEYTPRTSTESKYQAIESRTSDVYGSDNLNRGQYYIQLGEELYNGDLKLRNHTLDDFGRPARTWEYKGSEIGTYAKKELLVTEPVTVGIKGSEVYALLGQNTIRENDLDVYVDGYLNGHNNDATGNVKKDDLVRSNNRNLNSTGNGVLTEIYLDNDLELITIVSINTYLAQANADYNENTETVSLTVYNDVNGNGYTKVVDVEDVPEIVDLKKDDWVLVNWADRDAAASSKVVVNMLDVEIMVDKTVTGFSSSTEDYTNWNQVSSDSRKVTEITTDGETYKNNVNAYYAAGTLNNYSDDRLVNKTYNIFMDQYGYFIGAELYSGQDQYVFITGYDRPTSAIGVSTATARAIFADGTMDTIQVNVKDTNTNIGATAGYTQWTADEAQEEMWYRYSENRGVYTLSPVEGWTRTVAATNDVVIDCPNVRLVPTAAVSPATNGTGNSYGEDDSIYITVEYGNVDSDQHGNTTGVTDVTGVYTGVQSVKLIRQTGQWAHAVYDRNNNFIVACVVLGEAEGVVDNYAYIRSGAKNERYVLDTTSRDSGDRTFYWDVDVVMNGEATTKTIKSKYSNTTSQLVPGTVQELVLDADGYVTKINPLNNSLSGTPAVEGDDPQGTTAKKDEVYSNYDFINNGVNNTEANGYNSTDLADYSVYDINVSDKAFNDAVRAQNDQGIGAKGQQDWGYYSNLALQGNTLIFDASQLDRGLAIKNGAKAVVYHWVKNEQKYEDYTSVSAAFNALNDADGESSTNTVNLKQFSGRVIAVLNSNGQAEWVLFIDNTPENVKDPGYGGGGEDISNVTNLGGGNFQVRYTGNLTDEQIRTLMINTMESYTGMKVTSYNYPVGNAMVFADGSTFGAPATVTPIKQVLVKVDGVEVTRIDSGVAVPAGTEINLPSGNVYLLNATHGTSTISAGKYTALVGNTYTSDIEFRIAYQVNITDVYANARAKVDYKNDANGNWTPTDVPMYFAKNTQIRLTGQNPNFGGTYRRFIENITEVPLGEWTLVDTAPEQMLYTVTRDIQVSESTDYAKVTIDGHDYGYVALYDSNMPNKGGANWAGITFTAAAGITQGTWDSTGSSITHATAGGWCAKDALYLNTRSPYTTIYNLTGTSYLYVLRGGHIQNGEVNLVRCAKVTGISSSTGAVFTNAKYTNTVDSSKNELEDNVLMAPGDTISVDATGITPGQKVKVSVNGGAAVDVVAQGDTDTYIIPEDALTIAFSIEA